MSQQEISPEFKDMMRMVREYRENPFEMTPTQTRAMHMMMALTDTYDRWYNNLGAEEEAMERRRRATLSSAIPDLFDPQTPTRRIQSEETDVEEDDNVPPPALDAPNAPRRRTRTRRINRALLRPIRLDVSYDSSEESAEVSASNEDQGSPASSSEGVMVEEHDAVMSPVLDVTDAPRRRRRTLRFDRSLLQPTRLEFSDEESEDSTAAVVPAPIEAPASPVISSEVTPRRDMRSSRINRNLGQPIPFSLSPSSPEAPSVADSEESSVPSDEAPTTPRRQSPRILHRLSRLSIRSPIRGQATGSEAGTSSDSSSSSTPKPEETPRRRTNGERKPRRLQFENSEESTSTAPTEETSEEQLAQEEQQGTSNPQ